VVELPVIKPIKRKHKHRVIPAYYNITEADLAENSDLTIDSDFDPENKLLLKYEDFTLAIYERRETVGKELLRAMRI
jgi:hypothetical protein